jgi:hypothetical protein
MRNSYKGTARDGTGRIISGATIPIYLAGTNTLATIYETEAGTTGVNFTTSGTDGSFLFYVDRFDYDMEQQFKIVITKSGYTSHTYDNVDLDDMIVKTYSITADTTITTHLVVPRGVIYQVADGKTFTINGYLEAGLYQIFDLVGTGAVVFGSGKVKEFHREWYGIADTLADDATFNLPIVTNGGHGLLVIGADEERAQFTLKSDGTVNLIMASSNIVANANTDGKFCIGTGVASPCVIKNRLGVVKSVLLQFWYN